MAKIRPEGMRTNAKTRLNYRVTGLDNVPKCLTRHSMCSNYEVRCNDCIRIQGKYSEYKEKVGE